jgi:hypothetical protein
LCLVYVDVDSYKVNGVDFFYAFAQTGALFYGHS